MFGFECFILFLFFTWTRALDFDTPCPDLPVMQNVDSERVCESQILSLDFFFLLKIENYFGIYF